MEDPMVELLGSDQRMNAASDSEELHALNLTC